MAFSQNVKGFKQGENTFELFFSDNMEIDIHSRCCFDHVDK